VLKANGDKLTSGFEAGPTQQAVPCVQFDHEALDRPVMDEEDSVQDKLGRVINTICEWLYPKNCKDSTVLLRAYAFVWFMRPDWLGNPSQVDLAGRLKVSKATLGKVINQLRKAFDFYVAGMRGDAARVKFAEHARKNAKALADARRRALKAR
jgi:hypothetical protein